MKRPEFYKGRLSKKSLLNGYYIHPTLKIQPYGKVGFELVLWWIDMYVSIRIIF
jgi:hypothetical protein